MEHEDGEPVTKHPVTDETLKIVVDALGQMAAMFREARLAAEAQLERYRERYLRP